MASTNVRSAYTAYSQPNVDIEKGAVAYDFADAVVRRGFVRKVFGLLAVQLALTTVVGALIFTNSAVKAVVLGQPAVMLLAMFASLGSILYLAFSEKARHSHPLNLVLLGVFTLGEGVLVGAITTRYNTDIVLLAMGITAAVTVSLCAYALTTKTDFTGMGSWLYAALLSLFVAGIVGIFFRTPLLTLAMSTGGAVLFSLYIVYDVQLLMGGHHQCKVSPDEYVLAAINIYLDIINLFLYIMRILNEMKGDR